MGLKPYDRKISQVFNNIEYDVDFYQREYKWSDDLEYKPVSSLLKDIFYRYDLEKYNPNQTISGENTDKLEWYYLNSFMTNTIRGKKYIVDGQQRLTTLTLMSIALYHLSEKYELESHVKDTLKNSILGNTEFGKKYWMGFKDRDRVLDDILTNNLDYNSKGNNISEQNIYKNYKIIYNELSVKFTTAHMLHTFISYFRNRVYLIEIEIDKDKDVAMVFEVINDRGIPLKPYEILKGKLLSQIDINDRDKYIDIWEREIAKIADYDDGEIDEFFGFLFKSKYADNSDQYAKLDKSRYHKSIFLEDFNDKVKLKDNEGNVRKFIADLLPYYVSVYMKMLDCYEVYNIEYEHIYFNRINDIDGQFLLVLSSLKYNDEEKNEKLKIVPKLFDKLFVLSRLTNSYKSNEFNSAVISLNTLVREKRLNDIKPFFEKELLNIVGKAHDRSDLFEAFRYEYFKNLGYNHYGKKFLRYFFARIDHHISDFSGENEYANYYQLVLQARGENSYHIEHIITNHSDNITLFENEEEFNEQRNRLGALLLLKGSNNQSSGDEVYCEKLKTYNVIGTFWARSLLPDMYHKKVQFNSYIQSHNLNFKPYDDFAKKEIDERHHLLFELSKEIWN